ncbi:hypothetical protein QA646_29890 (plasmid) [Rhizobium sp. CB3090]|nr:hypothetical protein [Rhizobium sp. CB3090]WFU13411.1 hypothetical protein QA646_29890 [Rhizobium sp. CB3090]
MVIRLLAERRSHWRRWRKNPATNGRKERARRRDQSTYYDQSSLEKSNH